MTQQILTLNGAKMTNAQVGMLAAEQFLSSNYLFRRNVLSGKVEFMEKPSCGADNQDKPSGGAGHATETAGEAKASKSAGSDYRPLTDRALNSIILRAKAESVGGEDIPAADIKMLVQSEWVEDYDPVGEFLGGLPVWDGQNHLARLFSRLPGISTEQSGFLAVWLRSTVAHWQQMDTLHGNECVPVLIGPQGCGKTTFLRRLLPAELRQYYLDHLNLSNKFDKEMALTSNLFVNIDEFDTIRPSQQPSLKQTLSKSVVNGRPIYGTVQEDRPRYASFVASTNNPHPLTDATGSRRFICMTIPKGQLIDNSGDIDYGQLYAQVLYEIHELKAPYWFSNGEVARIQELNQEYMAQKDMAKIVTACFRKPSEGETVKPMNCFQLIGAIQGRYPSIEDNHQTRIYLGQAMRELGFERTEWSHVAYYKAVPLKAA